MGQGEGHRFVFMPGNTQPEVGLGWGAGVVGSGLSDSQQEASEV